MFDEHKDEITDAIADRGKEKNLFYAAVPREQLKQSVMMALDAYARDLDESISPHYFAEYWQSRAFLRAQQGMPLANFLQTLMLGSEELLRKLRVVADDVQREIALLERGYIVTASGIAAVYEGYAQHKDMIIQAQETTIAEVSLPIMPVHTGILVMPLIGAIDARRADQIMEGVLNGISAQQAEVVILDITGMVLVDTSIAHHLIQITRAAQLLGATVVLVGIRTDIAQTLVSLGVDLTKIVTLANLQQGITYALAAQGLTITQVRHAA